MPASPVPASSWRFIGRNSYGEAVEEDARGHRRVATEKGWVAESCLAPWRACRARSPEEGRLAMASLSDPWVSEGFGHNLRRAYVTYRLSPGQPLGSHPSGWGQDSDASWKAFEAGVLKHRGQRVLRAWLHRRPLAPGVPHWDQVLHAPGGTALRGVQWGLAHRLEEWSRQRPDLIFHELGLVDAADAATGRFPDFRRKARSLNPAPSWAPSSEVKKGWPTPMGSSASFGKKAGPGWTSEVVPVFWLTGASVSAHGVPKDWWPGLAAQPQGVVILGEGVHEQVGAAALAQALRGQGHRLGRWRLPGVEIWTWGWPLDFKEQPLSLKDWAQPVDPQVGAPPDMAGDEKVPYRALSKVGEPEGMASLALEASMHAALRDFSRSRPSLSVDEWVAEGLGIEGDGSIKELGDRLSPEQVDAVALARQSLEEGLGFLLSDETGFGKGRTLASLALTGLERGHTVVFITENPFLFSDFYRDLSAVATGPLPVPTLLHQSAKVVDPYGKVVATSLKAADFKNMLSEREWRDGQARLIFTTYAQLSRTHDGKKVGWLKDRMGKQGWLLLDEAHNAAGASSVGERIAELVKAANGTVFASATFAKHESNLAFYRPVLALPRPAERLLGLALAGDDGRLREALTQQMARAGRLVRREHPPVPPPKPVWVPLTEERSRTVEAFSSAWRGIFDAARAYSRLYGVQESVWLHLGAALSRSVREFSLQIKTDALIELIESKVGEDKKVVVVVDTTMEAALRAALTPEEDDSGLGEDEESWEDVGAAPSRTPSQLIRSGKGLPPLWRDRLGAILEAICPTQGWEGVEHTAAQDARLACEATRRALDALPDWDLSPLDRVRRAMAERDIPAGELSGRQFRILIKEDGWELVNRNDPDRNDLVRSFNAGEVDVMLVTRAGCAGISLHAGQSFKDQRVRCLVEWDIAANPVNRVQFWGRVRRKDQVVDPEFEGLVLDTPEDRRIIEREDAKRRKLTAHMGATPDTEAGWISPLGEALVAEWANERRFAAFQIGVLRPITDMPVGRVDRALVRSIVLPQPERQALLDRLDRGLKVGGQFHALSRQDRIHRPSRALQREWWWGDPAASTADPAQALVSLRLDIVERVWRPEGLPDLDSIVEQVKKGHAEGLGASVVLDRWRKAWVAETKAGVSVSSERKAIAKWLQAGLVGLDPGKGIMFTHPALGRPVRGVVLRWSVPDRESAQHRQAASAWALSQVAVQVWPAGDAEPLWIPLSILARDKAFKASGAMAPLVWFKSPPVPQRCLAVEGHPVQAAAWGRRWGWGRSALVRDEDEGSQVVWLLPPSIDWDKALGLPRDLVDVEHALSFWRKHPDEPLFGALPAGQRVVGQPVSKGLFFSMDGPTLHKAKESWLHHALLRRLRLMPLRDQPGWEGNVIAWKYVPRILHSLATAGMGWRVEAKHLDWYRHSSPERARSRRG